MLVVGSRNPVRDLDLAVAGAVAAEVLANRGLAGIDGWSRPRSASRSTRPAQPAYALLGDLTFLHDANGLLVGPDEPTPDLTVVVVNDDGGGIFTTLEPGAPERAADFERVFGTPTGTDLAALCRAHGIRHDLRGHRRRPGHRGRGAARTASGSSRSRSTVRPTARRTPTCAPSPPRTLTRLIADAHPSGPEPARSRSA